MERNANDTFGTQNNSDSSSGFGGSTSGSTTSADASFSRDSGSSGDGLADRARSAASTAGEKIAEAGSSVRERAAGLKGTIADALESGAERLRQQGAGGGQLAGASASADGAGMIGGDNALATSTNQLAGGLQASADWLRDADIDGLKSGLERQVKDHPGRTLAVAVGLGYLLGKAFKK